jgi:ATP-dependent Clp protease ATP-binding subunit ClpC
MGSNRVDTEHLLLGLVREQEGVAAQVLAKMGISFDTMQAEIGNAVIPSPPEPPSAEPRLTPRARRVLELSADEARRMKHNYIGTEHLLLGLLRENDGAAARVLRKLRLELDKTRQEVMEYLGPKAPTVGEFQIALALDAFGRDLTRLALEDVFDPVVGREAEMQHVLEILSRRHKRNALLVGKVGVGKTAIVCGVASLIAHEQVPVSLLRTRIVHLDVPALMFGVKNWSDVEERVQKLLQSIQGYRPVIFLDDVHGFGSREVAALYAVFVHMTRGDLCCIATTTPEGYERMDEDSVLRRAFQVVWVTEPTAEESFAILRNLRPRYEEFHQIAVSDGALTAAVEQSQPLPSALPEKAINVLDEACARVKLQATLPPKELSALRFEATRIGLKKTAPFKTTNTSAPPNCATVRWNWNASYLGRKKSGKHL